MSSALRRLPAWLLGACCAACGGGGEDTRFVAPGDGGAMLDASTLLDANMAASSDASRGDGAVAALSGADCRGDIVELHAARSDAHAFSTAVIGDHVFVAYLVPTCGGSLGDSRTRGIELASLRTSGSEQSVMPLVSAATTDCDLTSLPTLVALKQSVNLLYASNRGTMGAQELFIRSALDTLDPLQLTTKSTTMPDELAARLDNAQTVELLVARGNVISALRSGSTARPLTTTSSGYRVGQLVVSNVGTASSDKLAGLAWLSTAEEQSGIFAGFYGEGGALSEPVLLTRNVRGQSSVAIATQTTRAAVVYSDAAGGLFLRHLERDQTVGEPVQLTFGTQEVSDVAIARYGIGYIVAYRSVALAGGQSVVRLLAIDEQGNQAGTRFIAEVRSDGRGLDVRVANDGRLILTWAEPGSVTNQETGETELETRIRVARLTCL